MLKPLAQYLDAALNRTGARKSVDATLIVEEAQPLILQVLPNMKPADFVVVAYRRGQLTVAVANSVVGQELRLKAEAIMEVLRDTFPEHPFSKVRTVPLAPEQPYGTD